MITGTVLCLWAIGLAALWRRAVAARKNACELLSPVTILIGGFFWMYVVGYWTLDPVTSERYLSQAGYTKVLVLSVLTGAAFWLGARKSNLHVRRVVEFPPSVVSTLGALLIIVGGLAWAYFLSLSGGFFEYYGAVHGTAGAWKQTTAYVYGAIYLLFSGCVVLAWVHAQGRLSLAGLVFLSGAIAYLLFDAWMTGSRGYVLRLGLLACVYVLFWRRSERSKSGGGRRSQLVAAAVLLLLPFLFIVLPLFRPASHLGADQSLADSLAMVVEAASGRKEASTGHEVVFAAALVQAAWEQGTVDFGYLWLYSIVNAVPRLWWPDKPYVAEFSFDEFLVVWSSFGWLPTVGAAPTGVAEAFVRFSWLSPLVWAVFGLVGSRLYLLARLRRDLKSVSYFFCYLVGLSYMITQGFNAAVYAAMFMAVPLSACFAVARWLSHLRIRARYGL